MTDNYPRLEEMKEVLDQWQENFRVRLTPGIGHNGSNHTKACLGHFPPAESQQVLFTCPSTRHSHFCIVSSCDYPHMNSRAQSNLDLENTSFRPWQHLLAL